MSQLDDAPTDEPTVRLAAVQLPAADSSAVTNRTVALEAVEAAAADGADVIVLPELALLPYVPADDRERGLHWAEPVPGPSTTSFAAIARRHRTHVVLPLYQREEDGTRRNAAVMLGPDGALVVHRDPGGGAHRAAHKIHLPFSSRPGECFDEREHFRAGDHVGTWNTALGGVGALICYDRRFPEMWRALRGLGAWLCVVPVAGGGGDSSDFFLAELRTHARENGVVVVAANKVGLEVASNGARTSHHGDSVIIDALGDVLAHRPHADGPGVVTADVPCGLVARARASFPYYEHRRLDLWPPSPHLPPAAG